MSLLLEDPNAVTITRCGGLSSDSAVPLGFMEQFNTLRLIILVCTAHSFIIFIQSHQK